MMESPSDGGSATNSGSGSRIAANGTRRSKACVNCVRIKCKCIPHDGGDCQRCHRLKKTCVPSVSVPRRSSRPKQGSRSSRSQRLEAKISDLVDLLHSSHNISGGQKSVEDNSIPHSGSPPSRFSHYARSIDNTPNSLATDSVSESDPSPEEAELIFQHFRTEMLIFEPFVYFPPEATASQLRKDAPLLWLCIMAVASPDSEHRLHLGSRARHAFIDHVVSVGERSLAILHAILVLTTWFYILPPMDNQFSIMLAQLAIAVSWDLGLTLPPPFEQKTLSTPITSSTAPTSIFRSVASIPATCMPPSLIKRERTMNERRAILGVFIITASVPHMPEGLRWTPYLDDCLEQLTAYQKSSTDGSSSQDASLIRHARLRRLSTQMRQASAYASSEPGSSNLGLSIPAPLMESIQLQLDGIVDAKDALNNLVTHNLYHHTKLAIYEPVLARQLLASRQQQSSPPLPSAGITLDLRRFEIYQRCLDSARAIIDRLSSWPIELPCSAIAPLFYALVSLHKLSTLRDPVWDFAAVRESIDLIGTVDKVIGMTEKFAKCIATSGCDGIEESGAVTLAIRKFRTLRAVWQNDMPPSQNGRAIEATEDITTPQAQIQMQTPSMDTIDPSLHAFLTTPSIPYFDYFNLVPDLAIDPSWT